MSTDQHTLQSIIASIERLTPFPPIAHQALKLVTGKDVSIEALVDVIQYDPIITSKILQLCNSSYFWIKEEVVSLQRAVVILGTRNVINILLTHCIKIPEYNDAHSGYGLEKGELWRHSVSCAVLSRLLSESAGREDDAALFTAALLHDVGKLALNPFMEEKATAMEAMLHDGCSVIETEKAIFGIDHAELGGMIAAGWNLPDVLTTSIRHHHTSLEDNDNPGPEAWVRLTNLMAYICAFDKTCCHHAGEIKCGINPAILFRFGIEPESIDRIKHAFKEEMRQLDTLF